jgi:hypothetical protein
MLSIRRSQTAIILPLLVFAACALISGSVFFDRHPSRLTIAILLDLLITAPLLYFLFSHRKKSARTGMLRVFMAGVFVAGLILSRDGQPYLKFIKTFIAPCTELALLIIITRKFVLANRAARVGGRSMDFLSHCRQVMTAVLGNEKAGNILSSEIAVFYYSFFAQAPKKNNAQQLFTLYRENGIRLVLATFLGLFIIETTGVHFLLRMGNHTVAWIVTALSIYSCLQLFAHIRALASRPIVLSEDGLILRNGLLGGDAHINLQNIREISCTTKSLPAGVAKLALVKGLENHNMVIHLYEPVTIVGAFGTTKRATMIALHVDKKENFIEYLQTLTGKHLLPE